jgi:hypothetical protein
MVNISLRLLPYPHNTPVPALQSCKSDVHDAAVYFTLAQNIWTDLQQFQYLMPVTTAGYVRYARAFSKGRRRSIKSLTQRLSRDDYNTHTRALWIRDKCISHPVVGDEVRLVCICLGTEADGSISQIGLADGSVTEFPGTSKHEIAGMLRLIKSVADLIDNEIEKNSDDIVDYARKMGAEQLMSLPLNGTIQPDTSKPWGTVGAKE